MTEGSTDYEENRMWAGKKPSLTFGPAELAPEASKVTPMPPRERMINMDFWLGGELAPQVQLNRAMIIAGFEALGVKNIVAMGQKLIAEEGRRASEESMEFHAVNREKKEKETEPHFYNEIKKILRDESNVLVGNSLKTWKEIERMNCGRPGHNFRLDWFAKCLMEGKGYMVFGDHEKKNLRAELWCDSTVYFFPCEQCYHQDGVLRYVARNVRIKPKK